MKLSVFAPSAPIRIISSVPSVINKKLNTKY